jgi:N-acetylmuramoyl-L-alanine amidase
MIRTVFSIVVLAAVAAPPAALAGAVEDEYESLRAAYQKLKGDPAKRKFRAHWSKISNRFIEIAGAHKDEPVAPRALYTAAELFRDLRKITLSTHDLDTAVDLYGRVASEYPKSSLADDALYWKAMLLLDVKNDKAAACGTVWALLSAHAGGDMAPKAKKLAEGCPKNQPTAISQQPALSAAEGPSATTQQPVLSAVEGPPASNVPPPASAAQPSVLSPQPSALSPQSSALSPSSSVAPAGGTQHAVWVRDISCLPAEKGALVTVTLSAPAKHSYEEIKAEPDKGKPARIYLDVQDATLSAEAPRTIPVDKGFVKQVRAGQHKDGLVRVVLDLDSLEKFSIAAFDKPDRIVMKFGEAPDPGPAADDERLTTHDSRPKTDDGRPKTEDRKPEIPNPKSAESRPAPASVKEESPPPMIVLMKEGLKAKIKNGNAGAGIPLSEQLGLKFRRIVIDPGHGGEDNGAIGRKKTAEKDVALAVAKKLASKLKERLKIDVIMTRTGDQTVPLSERAALARAVKADLFISIHANANPNRKFRGIETYYLNNTDDRAAQKVAAVENAVSDKTLSDLKMTLLDLALSANVEDSIRLANLIQKNTVVAVSAKFSDVKDHGVKYALFYVLFGTEVPSVLVETSFISNPVEEQRLKNPKYQDLLAEGVFKGVEKYIGDRKAPAAPDPAPKTPSTSAK